MVDKISGFNVSKNFPHGLLNEKVYTNRPCIIYDLTQNIMQEVAVVPIDTLQHIFPSLTSLCSTVQRGYGWSLSKSYVKGCSFTYTDVCTYNILSL